MSSEPPPSRIEADYLVETVIDPRRAPEIMAGEQSSGTFVAVPGETAELKARAAARVERIAAARGAWRRRRLPGAAARKRAASGRAAPPRCPGRSTISARRCPIWSRRSPAICSNCAQVSGLRLLDVRAAAGLRRRLSGPAVRHRRHARDWPGSADGPLIGTIIKPSVGLSPERDRRAGRRRCATAASTSSRTTSCRPTARIARSTSACAP